MPAQYVGVRLARERSAARDVPGGAPAGDLDCVFDLHAGREPVGDAGRERIARAVGVRDRPGQRRRLERAGAPLPRGPGAAPGALGRHHEPGGISELLGLTLLAGVPTAAHERIDLDPAALERLPGPG